jgi:rare lipoprotein A
MRGNGDGSGMLVSARRKFARTSALAVLIGSAVVISGCGSSAPRGEIKSARSKEYFSESEYGVKASPRVSNLRTRLPRGGGRDMLGKPYKVKGQWYKPKEDPNYRKSGAASWYGDAFHGRLTANGEIYDMTHLTAAHPTMPLPSYARVTNLKNGSSVIVRVNDRGPFANGRIIDLSKRAAEMLDYKHTGVAQVQVDYLGRAAA